MRWPHGELGAWGRFSQLITVFRCCALPFKHFKKKASHPNIYHTVKSMARQGSVDNQGLGLRHKRSEAELGGFQAGVGDA